METLLKATGICILSIIALMLPIEGILIILGISLSLEDVLCISILLMFIVLILTATLASLNDLIKSDLS